MATPVLLQTALAVKVLLAQGSIGVGREGEVPASGEIWK